MIKHLRDDQTEETQLSVWLKNGSIYTLCDVPDAPFGIEGCVSFWCGDTMAIVPLEQVTYMEMNFEPGNDNE